MMIDGVRINNHVVMSSNKGSLYTDDGPFSHPTAVKIGKNHGLCTYHEMGQISTATTGQSDPESCRRDLTALIFRHKSIDELNENIQLCREKYGMKQQASDFLDRIEEKAPKVCIAYTQQFFSFNHTSTQRGEGYNDRLKGHADLKSMLSDADLVTLHSHVKAIEIDVGGKVLKILMKCRREEKRVAPIYENAVKNSLEMSAMYVSSCEKVEGTSSKYKVVRRNSTAVVVDLDTKIVHRGQVFTIPTCSCGYWCSSFRICMDIAKALIEDGRAIWSTNNYHPVHLVQLHPLWSDAIRKCKLEDYNDLPQIIALLGQKNEDSSVPAEVAATSAATNVCPDEYYKFKGTKKKVPKGQKERARMIQQATTDLLKVAVDNGDENTFQLALARVTQATKECMDMNGTTNNAAAYCNNDVLPLPPQPRVGTRLARATQDATNHSRLSASSSSSSTTKKKTRRKKQSTPQTAQCAQCQILMRSAKLALDTQHSMDECPNQEIFDQHFMKREPDVDDNKEVSGAAAL